MSDELSPLLSCPSLYRILRLLHSADDVISCRRVCKKLNQFIENDRRMKRHSIRLEITVEIGVGCRDYILQCTDEAYQYPPFCLTIRKGSSIEYDESVPFAECFKAIKARGQIDDEVACFKDSLLLIMNKFECHEFVSSQPVYFSDVELEILMEVIKTSGFRATECCIPPQDWKIAEQLKCEEVIVAEGVEGEEGYVDESLLEIKTDRASVIIGERSWGIGSIETVRRFLKEWEDGEREIFHLFIYVSERVEEEFREKTPKEFLAMLEQFNTNIVVLEERVLDVDLKRDRDRQSIRFRYKCFQQFSYHIPARLIIDHLDRTNKDDLETWG